ncbi:mitochondrial import inner membrane translocase subunit Tim50p [[Candida] railenensis]|uniref:Mitochondrial import inner membrane translocase subunit TIM50 n=1 Tax=[Candida] railenensis TaxID=45579 RepID=A0A9P0QKN4_9ASCO|nr:mitochondrial import inner membrane translocase subunit Tim50p [[Candida] railenensis]
MLRGSTFVRLATNVVKSNSRGVLTNNIARPMNSLKFYSTDKNDTKKQQQQQPQSILNEDMLAKAGFDDPVEKEAKSSESAEGAEESDGSETDSKSSRRKRRAQTSKDLQREKYANWFYLSTLVGGVAGVGYMARDWDSEEEAKRLEASDIPNGYSPDLMYNRFNARLGSLFTFFQEPAFENLLPPPAPEAYRRPLTLVLTLDDLLIHSEWDTKNGWRTAKRPGLDYFLGYLSQYYEIVIFGSNLQMYSEKAVAKLDPLHAYVSYALFREACRYKDGKLIKDLSLLNRDLGKTILIDVSPDSWSLQPENAIPMKEWDGKPDDTLIKLIPFLEYLATQPVKDVRPILNSFGDKTDVIGEFAKRELKLREQWKKDNQHLFRNSSRPNAGTFLASLMGVPTSQVSKEPKMPLDIIREHGQMQYEHFQKYLKENAPKFLEEEKKLKDEFGKITLNKLITEGAPTPESIAKAQAEKAQDA